MSYAPPVLARFPLGWGVDFSFDQLETQQLTRRGRSRGRDLRHTLSFR